MRIAAQVSSGFSAALALALMLVLLLGQPAIAATAAPEPTADPAGPSHQERSVVWAGGVMPRWAGKSGERPRHLRYSLDSDSRYLGRVYPFADIKGIEWSSWGADVAVGRGTLHAFRRQADLLAEHPPVSVVVTMAARSVCFGQAVYRRFTVEIEAGHTRPSRVPASLLPHREEGRCRPAPDYFCPSLVVTSCSGVGSLVGYLSAFQTKANAGMTWTGLGTSTVVGKGFMHRARPFGDPRGTVRLWTYPVRLRFDRPRWCLSRNGQHTGFAYTRAVTEVYGPGVAFDWIHRKGGTFERAVPPQRQRLLAQIGAKGVKRRVEIAKSGTWMCPLEPVQCS